MKVSKVISICALVGILVLGTIGIAAKQAEKELAQELAFATRLAAELYSLKDRALYRASQAQQDQSYAQRLEELLDQQLAELPQAARSLALTTDFKPQTLGSSAYFSDLSQSLERSADRIFSLASRAKTSSDRWQALSLSETLWNYAGQSAEAQLPETPDWIKQDASTNCLATDQRQQGPASVQALYQSLNAYVYAAQVYQARQPAEKWSDKQKTQIANHLYQSQQWQKTYTELIKCSFQTEALEPSYRLEEDPQQDLNRLKEQVNSNIKAALADPELALDSSLAQELLLKSYSS